MVRSAAPVLALLILPGFLAAQQTQAQSATHTVVKGDCLWNLAESFYRDPWKWRDIWNANREKIEDPNLIYPGQVFVIPGLADSAQVTGVTVEPTQGVEQAQQEEVAAQPAAAPRRVPGYTVFFQDTNVVQLGGPAALESNLVAVSRGQVYAAPWLTRGEQEPEHVGVLTGAADLPLVSESLTPYQRVTLELSGTAPSVGDQFLLYRVTRTIPDVGNVVSPTGTVTVTDVTGGKVTGIITEEYARVLVGDFLGPLPEYVLRRGVVPHAVQNGPQAMIMGMARATQVAGLNAVAFLDLGSDDGVAVGDEFELRDWSSTGNVVEGRLQVVGVKARTSSARVVHLRDNVFRQGVVVQLAKKMD